MGNETKSDELIEQFKKFVNNHPTMIQDVRNGTYSWQQFFEEWYLLGEGDPRWDQYKSNGMTTSESQNNKSSRKKSPLSTDWTVPIVNLLKKIDPKQVDEQINNLSKALGALQGIVSQFQKEQTTNIHNANQQQAHPFQFRQD